MSALWVQHESGSDMIRKKTLWFLQDLSAIRHVHPESCPANTTATAYSVFMEITVACMLLRNQHVLNWQSWRDRLLHSSSYSTKGNYINFETPAFGDLSGEQQRRGSINTLRKRAWLLQSSVVCRLSQLDGLWQHLQSASRQSPCKTLQRICEARHTS